MRWQPGQPVDPMLRPHPHLPWLLAAVLAVGACTEEPPPRAVEGLYLGDLVSFRVEEGRVTEFRVSGIDCTIPHPDYPVVASCVVRAQGLPDGELDLAGRSFAGLVGDVDLTGEVNGWTAEGTWSLVVECPDATPCESQGSWVATFAAETVHAPKPKPSTDAGTLPGEDVAIPPIGPDPEDPGPEEPPAPPEVPTTASDPQKTAADILAVIRSKVGVQGAVQEGEINAAAQAHADYYALHASKYQQAGLSPHQENPEWEDGFSGVSVGDRLSTHGVTIGAGWSEVMAFSGSPQGAMDGWMSTLYHRIPLVHPNTARWGFGISQSGTACEVGNVISGAATKPGPARWPVPWATGVDRAWHGYESPQPPLPEGEYYPSGPVITITFAKGTTPAFLAAELVGPDGKEVPSQIQTPLNDSWLQTTWSLYALDPLQPLGAYTVSFHGSDSGVPYSESWSFTTE